MSYLSPLDGRSPTDAAELRRVAGIDAASQALGHADLNRTLGIYGHRD